MHQIEGLLKASKLFNSLDQNEFAALVESVEVVEYGSGQTILRENEIGQDMYLVIGGQVQVFTQDQSGKEIVLAKLLPGDYFGEQALIPDGNSRRSASIRTLTETELIRITQQVFQSVLHKDSLLKTRLALFGEQQLKRKMARQSFLFRSLKLDRSAEWSEEITFPAGKIIFRQGDLGDNYYLILEGIVGIYQTVAGKQQLVAHLYAGQGFGELALLNQKPRNATAIAESDLRVYQFSRSEFVGLYEQTPELQQYLETLERVYLLPQAGFVTQHAGKFEEQDCITTIYHLLDNANAVASQVIGEHIYNISFTGETARENLVLVSYDDAANNIFRTITLNEGAIVELTVQGLWEELGGIQQRILSRTKITPKQIEAFQQTGQLLPTEAEKAGAADEIICDCLQLSRGVLYKAMRDKGCFTVRALAKETGASSVCGSCVGRVQDILGREDWTPAYLDNVEPAAEGIRVFRFKSLEGNGFEAAKPGQHVLVQTQIEGKWFQRPYTISSSTQCQEMREITVKKELQGYFSNWLFDQCDVDTFFRLSPARGEYYADLAQPTPIVCFVGGIGMTPALAIARSIVDQGSQQALYIDYSAPSLAHFAHRNELEALAETHAHIQVCFRATNKMPRLSQADVNVLAAQYPDADYFICGPGPFQNAAQTYLQQAAVPDARVHIETFTPTGGQAAHSAAPAADIPVWKQLLADKGYVLVGLLLLLAFLVQERLQIKWGWLEQMQMGESFKRWTGLALTIYLAGQWVVPYLRWQGQLKKAAVFYPWHKWLGAFGPLAYYAHSTQFGYAYLLVLSSIFFANALLGLINKEVVVFKERAQQKQYQLYWMILHVLLSMVTIAILVYHIFIVFYYQ